LKSRLDQENYPCLSQHPAFARWFTGNVVTEQRRATWIKYPCVECGKTALIGSDPLHRLDQALCPDHWLARKHFACRLLEDQAHLPENSLSYKHLFSRSARAFLTTKGAARYEAEKTVVAIVATDLSGLQGWLEDCLIHRELASCVSHLLFVPMEDERGIQKEEPCPSLKTAM